MKKIWSSCRRRLAGVAAALAIARTGIGVLSVEKDYYFEGLNT